MHYSILGGHSFKLSKDLVAAESRLNGRITVYQDKAQTLADEAQAFRDIPTEKLPPDWLQRGGKLYETRIRLRTEELEIIAELRRYYRQLDIDRRAAVAKAETAHADATAKVRADLIKIGYVDGLIPGGTRNCIQPGMIHCHPAVLAAKNEAESLAYTSYGDTVRVLDAREEAIHAELRAIRDKATSLA